LLILLVAVFAYAWLARRGSTLTRSCRWRLDRTVGAASYRCATCGAQIEGTAGKPPNQCLRG
jgi:LSD1 subclass zinc finger protein